MPVLVRVAEVPVMAPDTVVLPAPAKVSARMPAAMAVALSRVSVPASDWIVASAFKVTVPPKELVPERLRRAPLDDEPVPVRPRASAPTMMPAWSSSDAFAPTVVPATREPSAVAWEIDRIPALTDVVPSYPLPPESVVVPDPAWVSVPEPVMTFEKVAASLRLNVSAALLVTETVPSVPVVEPAPTWTVPEEIVKMPEKEFVPSMMRVFEPAPADLVKPAPLLISPTLRSVP